MMTCYPQTSGWPLGCSATSAGQPFGYKSGKKALFYNPWRTNTNAFRVCVLVLPRIIKKKTNKQNKQSINPLEQVHVMRTRWNHSLYLWVFVRNSLCREAPEADEDKFSPPMYLLKTKGRWSWCQG